jgi:phage terminase large subunit-like protein
MPWQRTTAQYLTALGRGDRWLYPEVATVVARQNGKTTLLVPLILSRLLAGYKVMHTAQTRELPREVFGLVVDVVWQHYKSMLRKKPRFANGQEEIRFVNGAIYRIVAPSRGGARGPANDLVIIDELREFVSHDFMAAAKPTLMASTNPQMVYLSNAGEDDSVVLNSIRARADSDPNLAYLEWSAAPERETSDRAGWYEANPAIGHMADRDMLANLEKDYQTHRLAGTLAIFETENLCRWVSTTREPLVDAAAWTGCRSEEELTASRPFMAVSMDPEGKRASVAVAWQRPNDTTALRLLFNVTGDPIDTRKLGMDLRATAARLGVRQTGFDPLTDAELVKYLGKTKPVNGREYANASAQFVNVVTAGKLRWWDADAVTDDLTWTARKPDASDKGSFEAVRSKDDRPITASLAAIRAVWLASGPRPAAPRVL